MGKTQIGIKFDENLLKRIDAICGRNGRTRWIEDACKRKLAAREMLLAETPSLNEEMAKRGLPALVVSRRAEGVVDE